MDYAQHTPAPGLAKATAPAGLTEPVVTTVFDNLREVEEELNEIHQHIGVIFDRLFGEVPPDFPSHPMQKNESHAGILNMFAAITADRVRHTRKARQALSEISNRLIG